MNKFINYTSILFATCGGFIASLMGGFDKYIKVLVIVMVLDFITGIIKSTAVKNLSSHRCCFGIFKKTMMLCIVCVSVLIESVLNVPVRYVTIMFFIANECISVLENASAVIPLPKKLVDVIEDIRSDVPRSDNFDKKDGD